MNSPETQKLSLLASDLDGTLIPLGDDEQNAFDLRTIASEIIKTQSELVFVTGRHIESVLGAIKQFDLPMPNWIICDVGTSIYQKQNHSGWELTQAYADDLSTKLGLESIRGTQNLLGEVVGLRLQEDEKQGRFKLSYYVDAAVLETCRKKVSATLSELEIPHEIIASVDPFNGDGLLDILPPDASKANALKWLSRHRNFETNSIVFAGDSGNDFHAMTAGFKTIVVGNANRELASKVEAVHREKCWSGRLFLSKRRATSGVLEGCRFFGLFDKES